MLEGLAWVLFEYQRYHVHLHYRRLYWQDTSQANGTGGAWHARSSRGRGQIRKVRGRARPIKPMLRTAGGERGRGRG